MMLRLDPPLTRAEKILIAGLVILAFLTGHSVGRHLLTLAGLP